MNCNETHKKLKAYITGDLATGERQAVRTHLENCPACRRELNSIDPLAGVLLGTASPLIPAGFAATVMTLARERQPARPGIAWDPILWWRLASTPMHVAAAVILVLGLIIGAMMGFETTTLNLAWAKKFVFRAAVISQFTHFAEVPSGSLSNSYLTLVGAAKRKGR